MMVVSPNLQLVNELYCQTPVKSTKVFRNEVLMACLICLILLKSVVLTPEMELKSTKCKVDDQIKIQRDAAEALKIVYTRQLLPL